VQCGGPHRVRTEYRYWESVEFILVIFQACKNHHRPGKVLENCDADLENSDVNYAEQYISVKYCIIVY